MRVWKICRQPYAATALDGAGGLHTSGRWHSKGHPIVYTASSAALAALEVLVHVDPLIAPSDLRLLTIDVPDDLSREEIDVAALPPGWSKVPAPAALQSMGATWLTTGRSAVLLVPSAIIPIERNVLVNPRHPEARRIQLISEEAFSFDSRLL